MTKNLEKSQVKIRYDFLNFAAVIAPTAVIIKAIIAVIIKAIIAVH
ncbi:MAG: hypothetical protein ACKVN8_07205 [Nitrosarchaeum sp.]